MQSNFSQSHSSSSHFSRQSPQTLEAEFYQITQHKTAQQRDIDQFSIKTSLVNSLKAIGNQLVYFLTGTQTLSVRAKRLKDGSMQWTVYDPDQRTCHRFDSETAVRSWLEQRHTR